MRTIHKFLWSVTLLLAACSPTVMAQTPTAASNRAAETGPSAIPQTEIQITALDQSGGGSQPFAGATETGALSETTRANDTAFAGVSQAEPPYENLTSPVDLLSSYYNAIARQEYERAYGYWEQPPLDYPTFAAGYADTAGVQLIVQPPTHIEGAAGSLYAEIPTVLVAQHDDGSIHTFAGCVVTRKSNLKPPDAPEEDVWHIYQAHFSAVKNNAAIPNLLVEGCQS
jgi:hypothetical protein